MHRKKSFEISQTESREAYNSEGSVPLFGVRSDFWVKFKPRKGYENNVRKLSSTCEEYADMVSFLLRKIDSLEMLIRYRDLELREIKHRQESWFEQHIDDPEVDLPRSVIKDLDEEESLYDEPERKKKKNEPALNKKKRGKNKNMKQTQKVMHFHSEERFGTLKRELDEITQKTEIQEQLIDEQTSIINELRQMLVDQKHFNSEQGQILKEQKTINEEVKKLNLKQSMTIDNLVRDLQKIRKKNLKEIGNLKEEHVSQINEQKHSFDSKMEQFQQMLEEAETLVEPSKIRVIEVKDVEIQTGENS